MATAVQDVRQARTTPTRQRLSPNVRKGVMVAHIMSGVGWMGLDIGLFVLMLTGYTTDSAAKAAGAYNAVAIVIPWSVPILSLGMLGSGLLLGWGTKWGILRYWWVFVKLTIGVILNLLVFVALLPGVRDLETSDPSLTADGVRDTIGNDVITSMFFPPIVSFTMLLISAILSIYKPWGKTSWSRK
jgi:hypothetical protein